VADAVERFLSGNFAGVDRDATAAGSSYDSG
jgi:hypothetical protein